MSDLVAVRNRRQIALGSLGACAGPQPGDADHVVELARAVDIGELLLDDERHPELLLPAEGEARRHHTQDLHRRAAHLHGAADDAAVAAEHGLPRPVRQDEDVVASRLVLVRQERSAEERAHAEYREDVQAEAEAAERYRVALALIRERGVADDAEVGERRLVTAIVDIVGGGELGSWRMVRPIILVDGDQPIRFREGKGTEQHAANDAEDRAVGADAERDGDEGDEEKAGWAAEDAYCRREVVRGVREPIASARRALAALIEGATV